MNVLADLKVVELASVLAGPLVGSFFAEAGAKVIKYENPEGGDITRAWKNAGDAPNAQYSAYFSSANYGKVYLKANLLEQEGKRQILSELEDADIVLTNFKKGDAEKFGLSQEFLSKKFPRLIHGQITGFGEDSSRTAFDMVLQAETGYLSMTGTQDTKAKIPIAMIDVLAAHQLKEGLLLALMQREKTGHGAHVAVSLYDSALSALINQGSSWLMHGLLPEPMGTLHPSIAPYGEILKSKDGSELVLAIGNNQQFKLLCRILGMEELSEDHRFKENPNRVKHRITLLEEMNKLSANHIGQELFEACMEAQLPVGRIRTLDQVFSDKEAQSLVLHERHDDELTKRISGNMFRITPNP